MPSSVALTLKRVLFGLLLGLLLWPAVQAKFSLVPVRGLEGWYVPAPRPTFSWAGLTGNSYQPQFEQYLQDRLGFRPLLIRLRNQLAYSLFDVVKAKELVVGKNEVLFQDWPIDAYYGRDYRGDNAIRVWVRQLKTIQDSLTKRGILFVFAIAPNKVAYYPEYIPEQWRGPMQTSNYSAAVREMQAAHINLLDLSAQFMRMKDTVSYPLFPRGGTHWSGYGATLAADTLLRYLEQRGHFDLPDYRVVGREVSEQVRGTDGDLAEALNLLHDTRPFPLLYPRLQYEPPKPGQKKPNVLIVGDSFVWSFIKFYDYFPRLFDPKSSFWYYHNRVGWPGTGPVEAAPEVSRLDRRAEIESRDVVLVLYSSYNLNKLDVGFTEYTYPFYRVLTAADSSRIQAIERGIYADWDLMKQLHAEAENLRYDVNMHIHNTAVRRFEAER